MSENEERQRVIEAAKTWLRTPYHDCAMVKNVGCDCLTLIAGSYEEAGIIHAPVIPKYSPQFMMHSSKETYLDGLLKYGAEVLYPKPADIAIWKYGRCFSHAAIVVEWPMVIHAYVGAGVQFEDANTAEWLMKMGKRPKDDDMRPIKFVSYWAKES